MSLVSPFSWDTHKHTQKCTHLQKQLPLPIQISHSTCLHIPLCSSASSCCIMLLMFLILCCPFYLKGPVYLLYSLSVCIWRRVFHEHLAVCSGLSQLMVRQVEGKFCCWSSPFVHLLLLQPTEILFIPFSKGKNNKKKFPLPKHKSVFFKMYWGWKEGING